MTLAADAPTPARRRRVRTRYVVAAVVCALAVVTIVVLAFVLSKNVVYYRTVTEAVELRDEGDTSRLRLAGEVVPGTIVETPEGVRFDVTDGDTTAAVDHAGDPPDLFGSGEPVVCEGRWSDDGTFRSDRILIKHGNEYQPPDVDSGSRD